MNTLDAKDAAAGVQKALAEGGLTPIVGMRIIDVGSSTNGCVQNVMDEGRDVPLPANLENLIPGIRPSGEVRIPYYREGTGHDYWDSFIGSIFYGMRDICVFSEEKMAEYDDKTRQEIERYSGIETALKLFRNQLVVDLGAGPGAVGYYFAALAGARGYVAVDKYCADGVIECGADEIKHFFKDKIGPLDFEVKPIQGISTEQDMLTFLKRLPDKSVSILASGIDGYLLPDLRYTSDVTQEIGRVLSPEGVYICHDSPALSYFLDKSEIEPFKPEKFRQEGLTRPFVRRK